MKKLEKLQNTLLNALGALLELFSMGVFIIILAIALVLDKIHNLFS